MPTSFLSVKSNVRVHNYFLTQAARALQFLVVPEWQDLIDYIELAFTHGPISETTDPYVEDLAMAVLNPNESTLSDLLDDFLNNPIITADHNADEYYFNDIYDVDEGRREVSGLIFDKLCIELKRNRDRVSLYQIQSYVNIIQHREGLERTNLQLTKDIIERLMELQCVVAYGTNTGIEIAIAF